ncbi:copia protein [Tanacetum coccineum]
MIIKKDSKIVKAKGERKSLALKAKKESSDEECSTSGSEDEEYAMVVGDFKKLFKRRCSVLDNPNHLIGECLKPPKDKNQRAFIGGSWSDRDEEDNEKDKDETCLMAQASNEVCSDSSYFSDENSAIDDSTLDKEYDKLCKMSLKIITKNKQLKAIRNSLKNELCELKLKLSALEKNKGVDLECINCQSLKIDNEKLKEESLKLTKFEKSTHCLNEMLRNQKPFGDKLGLGFNSFEASTSKSKEIKFVKFQKETPSGSGPPNTEGSPHKAQTALKAIKGSPIYLPESKKSVSFQKSILGPRPKHIMVNNVKIPVASDNEICLGVDLQPDQWLKDSECSKHMTGNRKLFSTYKAYNGGNVIFGSNHRGNIIGKGKICDNKCRVTFSEYDSEITKDNKVIGIGIRKKGLYVIKLENKLKDKICLATIDENSMLWHRRLGHANLRLIQSLAYKELVRNLPKLKFDQHFCDACKIGKQAHASHKAKNIVSMTRCLELLHMDLFGPSAVRSYKGNLYTLVMVDDYSRYTWTRFLKNKIEAFEQFEIFSKKIQNQLRCSIVSIRTDHGREFDNELQLGEFCNSNDEEEAIKVTERKNLENDIEDETLEIDEVVNIKESKNHPLENVIGNLNQRTLRLVAQGYNQQEGIDYDETYVPVARLESIRIVLAYACALDYKLFQMDVKSAFLNGFINEEFEMSMMGELNFFLGLQIKQMEDGIFFNQSKYIKEMLKKFGLEDSKPMKTPMSSDTKLTKDEECESVDSTKYRGMIGSLLYLTASRPDIMFSVCLCARFQEDPKTSHLEAVKRIFQYIKGTTHLGLWYPKRTGIETVVYADSDHTGDYVDRKSTSGICTFVGCCLTSWFMKKQTALAISTTEAEYVTMPRITRLDHQNTRNYIPILTSEFDQPLQNTLKLLEKRYFHEGRVVSQNFENMNYINAKFESIGFECLLKINEKIVPRFVLEFYSQLEFNYSSEGHFFVHFAIQNKSFSFTLEEFGHILGIPSKGHCSYSDKWPLGYLKINTPTKGRYQTTSPSPSHSHSNSSTRFFTHIVFNFPELSNDRYILCDRVIHPLAPHYERKTRSDHGMKRCRSSNPGSSSNVLDHPLSSNHIDENDDENNEESFHSNTPSPSELINSLSNVILRVFENPPHENQTMHT